MVAGGGGWLACWSTSRSSSRLASTDRSREVHRFADTHQIPWVDFVKARRKDDVAHERAGWAHRRGRGVFIGRAQEKTRLFQTENAATGRDKSSASAREF